MSPHLAAVVDHVDAIEPELVELRRDLHAHPELAWQEQRTTALVADRLTAAGVKVQLLPESGLIADIGNGAGPVVALRADLDALAVQDLSDNAWTSTVPGIAHACGHDVHASALVGAGVALAELNRAEPLNGRVRLMFQPAEEIMPGGALELIAGGVLEGVDQVFGLHCDPSLDVGVIGMREGPITGAADALTVRLSGRGGHTSRPHLTEDLTFALGKLVTDLPGVLSRRLDPRAGASVVWGMVRAGASKNVIPASGEAAGTVRMLDAVAWADAEDLVRGLIHEILAPYGVTAEVDYVRGVPPVVNDPESTQLLHTTVVEMFGSRSAVLTQQSLGGEDFAWYLEGVPGAMGRLGTRRPGGRTYDLHQGDLEIDERSIGVGARVLAGVALSVLSPSDGTTSGVVVTDR